MANKEKEKAGYPSISSGNKRGVKEKEQRFKDGNDERNRFNQSGKKASPTNTYANKNKK
ncbi:hypothetical protein [Bacillus alveayuensis]|uniref:hypothetical protein n=1 Tax=Aeribacillus alveayuensis TaxID=279215 RepID=UPI001910F41D|nr:hypothetical protein [Bacillus alveayuensis]